MVDFSPTVPTKKIIFYFLPFVVEIAKYNFNN